jgi:DNA gyrase subunit A
MCAQGYGKRTPAEDYKVQNRGGKGIITIKVNNRNGPVVGSLAVQTDDQIMLVTNRGKVIRTRVSEISAVGRNTMGVRVIRTVEDERVVAIERLVDQDDASVVAEAAPPLERVPEDLAESAAEDETEGDDGDA